MGVITSTVIATVGVLTTAYGVVKTIGAYGDAKDALNFAEDGIKNAPKPPKPQNVYTYNDDGSLASSLEFDEASNSWKSKTYLSPAEQAKKDSRDKALKMFYQNLEAPPEDLVKMYDEYANTLSTSMNRELDDRVDDTIRNINESMNQRGMTGSRASVDTFSEIDKNKRDAQVDIAERSTLAKHDLLNADKNYWLNAIGLLEGGANADAIQKQNASRMAAGISSTGTSSAMDAWKADLDMKYGLADIASKRAALDSNFGTSMINTGAGLLYLYGLGSSPLKSKSKGGGGVNMARDFDTGYA